MTKSAALADPKLAKAGSIVPMPGFPESQSVIEYCVASSQHKMHYPGIQQCISFTAVSGAGLVGAHISPGASMEQIALQFQLMMAGGARNATAIYIVGNFDVYFECTAEKIARNRPTEGTRNHWTSLKTVVDDVRKYIGAKGKLLTCNTSELSKSLDSYGIDIYATKSGEKLEFKCRSMRKPNGTLTTITGPFKKA